MLSKNILYYIVPHCVFADMSHAHVVERALKKIVPDWYELGLLLEIENNELDEFKCDFQKVKECRREMIHHWLQSGTATRCNLISALKKLGREDVAEVVESLPKS